RLLQMLTVLQAATADLSRSSNRRTDAELCLIRLSDERLDESFAGLAARVASLEERLAQGVPAHRVETAPAERAPREETPGEGAEQRPPAAPEDTPPWEVE